MQTLGFHLVVPLALHPLLMVPHLH
jgi:hypothetical protein